MRIFQRIKNYANNSIICVIKIEKPNKSECKLFVESLNKDGDLLSTTVEKLSYSEISKIVTVFSSKMKKLSWLNTTPVYLTYEIETQVFINPELMEKERVGFELYGLFSDKNVNTDLVAYYSFSESGIDFRQPLIHDSIFGFFALSGFETPYNGLKNSLLTYGLTFIERKGIENYFIIMSSQEYERQYKQKAEEPKKRHKKKIEVDIPLEILQLKKQLERDNSTESISISADNEKPKNAGKSTRESTVKLEKLKEEKPQETTKRGRGRPSKK